MPEIKLVVTYDFDASEPTTTPQQARDITEQILRQYVTQDVFVALAASV